MSGEYILTREVLGRVPEVAISSVYYEELKDAKVLVLEALGVEERIDLVLANYVEYESFLLRGALEHLVYAETSWSDFSNNIHTVNRYLLNLLSACRSYLDQLRHFASSFFGKDSDEYDYVCTWLNEQYDSLLGFRVMEALRNFAQHRGLAVHHLTVQLWWTDPQERSVSRSTMTPAIQPERLREEGGFKTAVLEELDEELVDLRPLVKQYVSGISVVHGKVRELLKEKVAKADGVFLGAIDRYMQQSDQENVVGLFAARVADDGTWAEQVQIFADPVERRRILERRHRIHKNFWMHYVTNEPKELTA